MNATIVKIKFIEEWAEETIPCPSFIAVNIYVQLS
jgi:hypothetical protein